MLRRLFDALRGVRAGTAPGLHVGGLYAVPREAGAWTVLKILALDDVGVHVRTDSNVFPALPQAVDEAALYMQALHESDGGPLAMGHMPISHASFAGWGARFVQPSTVTPDELEGFEIWREAQGGYF